MRSILVPALFLMLGGCAAKRVQTVSAEPPPPAAVTPVKQEQKTVDVAVTDEKGAPLPQFQGATLHFDFDESTLSQDDTSELVRLSDVMHSNKALRVTIAGHADERGTTEYNLALGNKRAEAARKYLITLGVDAARIDTISFGEEKPAQIGETEQAFAANRRDEISPR
ncbi:MAG: OmpA family protein [Myxococcaceae bacterium]